MTDAIKITEIKPGSPPDDVVKLHPCMNGEAHLKFGRIHLPVNPVCNIGCRFCGRGIKKDQVPGASGRILMPQEDILTRALELCPEITVAGVAGPGDALASPHAVDTFRLIGKAHPKILKCLSTNGLSLPGSIAALREVGINSLTVTIKSLAPETLTEINGFVIVNGKAVVGLEAAKILIDAQLAGLKAAAKELHAIIKINTIWSEDFQLTIAPMIHIMVSQKILII